MGKPLEKRKGEWKKQFFFFGFFFVLSDAWNSIFSLLVPRSRLVFDLPLLSRFAFFHR